MGVKIEQRTPLDLTLKIVASVDSSIDWPRCYAGTEHENDSDDQKRQLYLSSHDASVLAYCEDDPLPTVFIFKHPKRGDASRAVRRTYTGVARGEDRDMIIDVWQENYLGLSAGFEGIMQAAPRHSDDQRLSDKYLQALLDSRVLGELAFAYLKVANKGDTKDEAEGRAKK